MRFAVLGLFGLVALATAYPYPSFDRYRPEPAPRYQYPEEPQPASRYQYPEEPQPASRYQYPEEPQPASRYQYPEEPQPASRYQYPEEPQPASRYQRPEEPQPAAATHDDKGEFKGLLNALVESMDHSETQEKEEQESDFRQPAPDRFGYSNNYNNFEDLENALFQEKEQPARKPSIKAEEKLQLQSHQREILNEVEEELQKHSDAKPGSKEYEEAMEAIRGKFHHNGRVCADGSLEANCLQSACEMGGVSCPAHVEAVCVDDFCGGCNYYFAEGDKRYTREECYSTEGLEQKAFQSAKEVLAQYGNDMEFEELVKKVNERLEHPQSQSQSQSQSRFQPQTRFQPQSQSQSQFQPQTQTRFQPQSQSQTQFQPQTQSQTRFQPQIHHEAPMMPVYQPEEKDEDTADLEELFRRIHEKLETPEIPSDVEEEEPIHTDDDDITKPFGQKLSYERPDPESQSYYERPIPESYKRPDPESQSYYERPVPESYKRPDPESQSYYERPIPESAYRQRYPETYRPRYEGMSMEPRPRFGKVEMAPNRYGMNGGYRNPYRN